MTSIHPTRIPGRWSAGFALDYHTISSDFVGHDEYGHPKFDTKRSELGELLYRLKYGSDSAVIVEIGAAATEFLRSWNPGVGLIVPVPPSRTRGLQPVSVLAETIGKNLGLPVRSDAVTRVKAVPQLKDVFEYDARVKLLHEAHSAEPAIAEGKRILLFDDLFRSGATMNSITETLYQGGKASEVFVLTITRTRSRS
jgi:predicted amidophosphoribosyltransferase